MDGAQPQHSCPTHALHTPVAGGAAGTGSAEAAAGGAELGGGLRTRAAATAPPAFQVFPPGHPFPGLGESGFLRKLRPGEVTPSSESLPFCHL